MFFTFMFVPGAGALNKPPPIREVATSRAHSPKPFSPPRQLTPLMIAGTAEISIGIRLRPTLLLGVGIVYTEFFVERDATPLKPARKRKYNFKVKYSVHL